MFPRWLRSCVLGGLALSLGEAACSPTDGARFCGDGTAWNGSRCVSGPDAEFADGGIDGGVVAPDSDGGPGTVEPTECQGTRFPGPCVVEHRPSEDAGVQARTTVTYDASKRVIRRDTQVLDEGVWKQGVIVHLAYDGDKKQPIREEHEIGGEIRVRITWTYRPDGQPLTKEQSSRFWDGEKWVWLGGLTTYAYDPAGLPQYLDYDHDDDGVHYRTWFTHDDQGRLRESRTDLERDGSIDARITYSYDDAGRMMLETIDSDADGQPNAQKSHRYDLRGNRVRTEFDEAKQLPDGTPDRLLTYRYDVACNVVREETDLQADGVIDEIVESLYGCW